MIEEININQLEKLIENKEDFILQISLEQCPYCLELRSIEEDLVTENSITIYEYTVKTKSIKGNSMEKLCSIKGSKLYFNGEELLKIESIEKIEVKTLPVRQAIKSQLLNSMATFMSGSLINGNEQCIVGLNIIQKDKEEIWIPFHEGSVTRFNLDYHQYVKNARELKDKILKYIIKTQE